MGSNVASRTANWVDGRGYRDRIAKARSPADRMPPAMDGAPPPPPVPPIPKDGPPQGEAVEELEADLDSDLIESADEPLRFGLLDEAIEEARAARSAGAKARRVSLSERELPTQPAGEADRKRAALYHYEIGELLEVRGTDEGAAVKANARALQADPTLKPNLWAI